MLFWLVIRWGILCSSKLSTLKFQTVMSTMTLDDQQKKWEDENLNPVLKRFPERKAEFQKSSGIPLPLF